MEQQKISAKDALQLMKRARPRVNPNWGFIAQLLTWEKAVLGQAFPASIEIPAGMVSTFIGGPRLRCIMHVRPEEPGKPAAEALAAAISELAITGVTVVACTTQPFVMGLHQAVLVCLVETDVAEPEAVCEQLEETLAGCSSASLESAMPM